VLEFLSIGNLREMLLVAAFPMPQSTDVAAAAEAPGTSFTQSLHDVIAAVMPEPDPQAPHQTEGLGPGLSTTLLQLAYPWLKTTGSSVLLEGIEPPDGALAGLLARNALTRGTFTSATKVPLSQIFDVSPILPAEETTVSEAPLSWGGAPPKPKPLIERLSLFGFTPSGLALLSDVTAYAGESYRPGRIYRLVTVIRREARRLGEDLIFQSNGPALWARVQATLRQLMTRLWRLDALDGATASDAFSVRCDRSTMTQNDLDSGRLVATISFNAASTIELIRVTLALQTSEADPQSASASMEAG
jgi:phage tail sheath protein FI